MQPAHAVSFNSRNATGGQDVAKQQVRFPHTPYDSAVITPRVGKKRPREDPGSKSKDHDKGGRKRAVWWPQRTTFKFKDVTKHPQFDELMRKHQLAKELSVARFNHNPSKATKMKGVYKRRSGKNNFRFEVR